MRAVDGNKALFTAFFVLAMATVLLVPVGPGTAVAAGAEDSSALVGTWQGVVDIPGQPLPLIFVFVADGDGGLEGTVDIPVQGAFGLRLEPIEVAGSEVRFAFADIPAFVTGDLIDGGARLEGVFHQSGMDFPFEAVREGGAVTAAAGDGAPATDDGAAVDREVSDAVRGDDEQLDAIRAFVEEALEDWGVAGAAVTIVHDGHVIMAEGFGLRDVEQQLPVTSETLFGIGSSTKAFTATAVQMLVEEGVLQWDEPLRNVWPGFRLADPVATEHATALDFALHRSGLPRHDMLWMANPGLDSKELLQISHHLTPAASFRETWMYNNFGYALLGELVEEASGRPWDEFVKERLLQPLGMTATNFTVAEMEASDNYARAYIAGDDRWEEIPLAELGGIAAAGAINSNAADMGKWLLFQLNNGRVDGEELLSLSSMVYLRTPHISLGSPEDEHINFSSYGLGWMVDSYRGHYRVHHGGNTIGYSADVAFIPSEGIGVAVLTNGLFSPAPTLISQYVLDTLLGLEPMDRSDQLQAAAAMQATFMEQSADGEDGAFAGRRMGTTPSHDLSEYAGVYEHPAYGKLHVTLEDDELRVTYYEFEAVLEHWHFDQFRGALSPYVPAVFPFIFETDGAGDVGKVHVSLEPSVQPIVFVRGAEIALTERTYLEQFVGEYDLMGAAVVDVSYRNDALVLTVPGQPPYVLAPTREGQFVFRDFEGFGVHFVYGDDGMVERAVLIQPHGNVEMTRK